MKKKLTELLCREIAGSGDSGIVDQVKTLLERRSKGQKLTRQEASVIADTERSLADILGVSQSGYCPDRPAKSHEVPPLPFSSFAEGLAQLQDRFRKRGIQPKVRTATDAGAYQADMGTKGRAENKANATRIAAIVRMAQDERGKLRKPSRKKK